jgi:hypothetical protein
MKNLFVLALALVMTCTFAFAQSQSPYAKGKSFGKELINLAFSEDEDGLETLATKLESYMTNNVQTEQDVENFLNGLEAGMREGCKANGLSDEETDEVIEMLGYALLEGMMGSLDY